MKRASPTFRGTAHTARTLSLQALLECRRHDSFVQEILDRQFAEHSLSAVDRRLVTQLTYGVLRRRGTLEAILAPLINRPGRGVEPWLWDALFLGAYQLTLLSHIPIHAAVHETVELAVAFGRPEARGFLNGILRRVAELTTDEKASMPAANAFPLEDGTYRLLAHAVFPDPATHPLAYLSQAFGLPEWLTARWLSRFGFEECSRLGFWFAGSPGLTLRCHLLRCRREVLLEALRAAGCEAEAGSHPQAIRLRRAGAIRDLPGYADGWFSVQDESAMRVASALDPQPGESVLDLCAAPGGKTTHLAEYMRNTGRIVACDVDEKRLRTVESLAQRLRLSILETHRLRGSSGDDLPEGPFDRILVDVPCSNTGVLGKRPEARWRLRAEEIAKLAELQKRLLCAACRRVRGGGTVVYSTCSIEPEENRQVVENVLRAFPNLRLEAEGVALPGQPADGGYWARLRGNP